MGQLFTIASGWILVALVATTATLPFVLRRSTPSLAFAGFVPLSRRMRPHFLLGYTLLPLAFAHAWPAMSEGWVRQVNETGLYLASVVFLLLPLQIVLGSLLRGAKLGPRPTLRRVHFWTMATIVAFSSGHLIFNSGVTSVLSR
jgi:thiosulfate reductase cytochrome b subunit